MGNASPVITTKYPPATAATTSKEMPVELKVMIACLHEIIDMDTSDLTCDEKKAFRKETRAIKAALMRSGNGICPSVGALLVIIIIILLI